VPLDVLVLDVLAVDALVAASWLPASQPANIARGAAITIAQRLSLLGSEETSCIADTSFAFSPIS
jgi:hypothetical protein